MPKSATSERSDKEMKSQALENIGTPPSDYQSMASGPPSKSPLKITSRFDSDDDLPLLKEREGDVISAHRALLTLAKGFVGTGCLSLPYAWKQGGIWMSFVLQFVISTLNWYSNHILCRSSQYLAAKYIVNATVLLYQLGCCSVPIVFVATNFNKIFKHYFNFTTTNTVYSAILLVPLILVNMVNSMRVLSYLAITATFLWLFGAIAMLQQCIQMPSQWDTLPGYTDFWSTVMFFGTAMYSYEGQTMILPIENKLRFPEEFTENCGVLPTLMVLITVFYTALGFYGFTAFGENTLGTLPLNMPDTTLFMVVSMALTIMAFLAHPVNLYVVFEMFWSGFKRKVTSRYTFWYDRQVLLNFLYRSFWVILTFLIVIFVPRIEQIVSLVGITGGSLCAFVYPPILEMLTFRKIWRAKETKRFIIMKVSFNIFLVFLGIFLCIVGLYINLLAMYKTIGT